MSLSEGLKKSYLIKNTCIEQLYEQEQNKTTPQLCYFIKAWDFKSLLFFFFLIPLTLEE